MRPSSVPRSRHEEIKSFYREGRLSVPEISRRTGYSANAIYRLLRAQGVSVRSHSDDRALRFERKPATFTRNPLDSEELRSTALMGAMLYWGEGAKRTGNKPCCTLDFSNSDPLMMACFMRFLTEVYSIDRSKLRVYLYCYADQDIAALTGFWSSRLGIPKHQFTKPYVRKDFNSQARKMRYGLAHIRYHDKKLLLDILNMIDWYAQHYAPIV